MLMRCLYATIVTLPLILWAFGCAGEENKSASTASGKQANLLLITLDTTRADRLGVYGYKEGVTPALDRLASEGVRLDRALASVPLTLPSHATLMTGLNPPEHGLHLNGSGGLGPEADTLAEILSRNGYRTAAFISAFVLDSSFGLDQGFGLYSDDLAESTADEHEVAELPADKTADRALAWLDEDFDSPFFCWVHFYDPHDPYEPPEPFRSQLRDAYDGEVAFVDSQVGRLITLLDRKNLASRTVVVVAGDHGESLGDHGEKLHGFFIYNSTLRVPLIIRFSGHLSPNQVIVDAVGLVDVFPTVLELLGIETSVAKSGRSLVSLLMGEQAEPRSVYSESQVPLGEYNWSPLYSLTTSNWKYIESSKAELYNLLADPGESVNLVADNPDVYHDLKEELADLTEAMVPGKVSETELDPAAIERLRALGYVQLQKPLPKVVPRGEHLSSLKCPRDMIEVFQAAQKAQRAIWDEDYGVAVNLLEPIVKVSPESVRMRFDLASAYFELRRYSESANEYRVVLELNPINAVAHSRRGVALDQLGEPEAAIRHFRHAIRIRPDYLDPYYGLVDVLARLGRVNEAKILLANAASLQPAAQQSRSKEEILRLQVKALSNLGSALAGQGRPEEGISMLTEALALDPDFAPAENNLGVALLGQGDVSEALLHLRKAVQLAPDYVDGLYNLGKALAIQGELSQAVRLFERAIEVQANDAKLHNDLGVAYYQIGKHDLAIDHFREALKIDSQFEEARRNLRLVDPSSR